MKVIDTKSYPAIVQVCVLKQVCFISNIITVRVPVCLTQFVPATYVIKIKMYMWRLTTDDIYKLVQQQVTPQHLEYKR
jgi:hypothetical protein